MKIVIAVILSSVLASSVNAHSKVDTTTPSNQAVLAEVPTQIDLDFAKRIRLTKVEITHESDAAVPVDLDGQTSFERAFSLPLQNMGHGTYQIEWRGLGMDGHAMQGEFTFEVN